MKSIFQFFDDRFSKPLPTSIKRFIFGLYGVLLSMLSVPEVRDNPTWFYRLSIGLIVFHFLLELTFPLDKEGLLPAPPHPRVPVTLAGLVLLLCASMAVALTGCSTFKQCEEKFITRTIQDTTEIHQVVSVVVPRDSIILITKTDTTHYIHSERQGRATVTIIREPINTTVIAECDSVHSQTVIQTNVPTTSYTVGIAPWYKWAFWSASALLAIVCVSTFIATKTRR